MKITIVKKIRPFSHLPGTACLIPGTCVVVEAFPTLLRFHNFEYPIEIEGPVTGFTLLQDLEKNCVYVFGKGKEKFYRFRLHASAEGFYLFSEKTKQMQFFPADLKFHLPATWERLSLGSHKAQDWDLVLRRFDLKEILPVLFGLGQKIPEIPSQTLEGIEHLLRADQLENFCRAAFSKILIPTLKDEQHLGLVGNKSLTGDPCFLLQAAFKFIRSLFFVQDERRLSFLPSTIFPEGRLIGLQVLGVGEIDLEWASRRIRRMIIRAFSSGEVVLILQREIKGFRLRCGSSSKGKKQSSCEPLCLEAGKTYFLDNFQK